MKGICDVCKLLDTDYNEKEVFYCKECNAYICELCKCNYLRRGIAMIKSKLKK